MAAACSAPAVEPDLLIDAVTVIDGAGDRAIPDRAVAIRDGQVVAIAAAGSIDAGSRTIRIDGRGKFLIPGLWDMHVHLAGYGERAFPLFLANGVTTVREMGGNLARLERLRDEVRSGQRLGPELLIAGPVLDAPFLVRAVQGTIYAEGREAVADSTAAVFWVDSLSRVPVDQIKVHSMTPRAAYLAIVARARHHGIPVGGHVPDSLMPREVIEAGQRTIEHTWRIPLATSSRGEEITRWELAAMQPAFDSASRGRARPPFMIRLAADDSGHASFDSARAAEFGAWAARREVWFDPTLVVIQAFLGMPGAGDTSELRFVPPAARLEERAEPPNPNPTAAQIEALRRRYLTSRRPIEALIRSGAKFIAGTDVPVMPLVPGFALHHELAALVDAGLTPMQAIQAASRNAAQAAGRIDQVGTIEAGKRADLVLLDADPLADIANTRRIRSVITRGRLLDRPALDSMLVEAEAFARAAAEAGRR
jgi:imidazolonepropionase-like amidohydrolase